VADAPLAGDGLDTPEFPRGGSAVGRRGRRAPRAPGDEWIAGQNDGAQQSPQAARRLGRGDRRVVADSEARCAQSDRLDAEVGERGGGALVAADGLAGSGITRAGRWRKAQLVQVLEAVQAAFEAHPLTAQLPPEVLAGWTAWAAEHAKTSQRASSAVEGRNGYLSQMHHHHRGLPKRRYEVWSARHNFDGRASDRSTPASRFFRQEFPGLFGTVLSQIEELPRARKRQSAIALSD